MRGKRGQFYLLAAIIIITLIFGFVTISNYSYKKTSINLGDLKEEIEIESQNVISYDSTELGNFVYDFSQYAGDNKNLYFIFGTPGALTVKAYEDHSDVSGDYTATQSGGEILITIDEVEYEFDLLSGQNFYFIVSQEIEGEKYIVTG